MIMPILPPYHIPQYTESGVLCKVCHPGQSDNHQKKIERGNIATGDGIVCVEMPNIWQHIPGNDFRNICTSETYKAL